MITVVVFAVALLTVRWASALIVYFQEGANPAAALHIVPNLPPDLRVRIAWQADDRVTGASIEPSTRVDVQSAYLRAWLQWNLSYMKGAPYGLQTYFTGQALADASGAVIAAASGKYVVEQADMNHQLQLHFFSADGSVVSFTDHNVDVAQIISTPKGVVAYAGETVATYDVVMLLEDGNWRVRHWVRVSATPIDTAPAAPARQLPGIVSRLGTALMLDGKPYAIDGVNYYPQATPWHLFWSHCSHDVTDADFARIAALGLNTVRIFVPYDDVGGPNVQGPALDHLADLLRTADRHHLKVVVTLFDFWSGYSLLAWPGGDRYLITLLTRFRDDPAILAWDLKNEPDLDYAANTKGRVQAWLAHVAWLARQTDPHHLITIGWSTPQAADALVSDVDFVTFHYYAAASALQQSYAALRASAPNRPIVLGEYGLSTWDSLFVPFGHSEGDQQAYYADVLTAIRRTDSAGTLAWTLYDFSKVPADIAGRWFWKSDPQGRYGLLNVDGTPKPAAALVRPGASLKVARPPIWQRVLKPFWLLVLMIVAACVRFTMWIRKRR
jgi:Cellulase (glycosyl hydrolase family 5)